MRLARDSSGRLWAQPGLEGPYRPLTSDPFGTDPGQWVLGEDTTALDDLQLGPPLRPGKIVAVGRNYVEHAAELGNPMPSEPLLFLKPPSAVVGPGQPIRLPFASDDVQFEGEIGLVIGRRLYRPAADEARDAILGVTAANDVTARDLQRADRTFTRGKGFDSFCPIGPVVLVGAELESLSVETRLDGEVRQHGTVAEMAFGPVEVVSYIASIMTLEPGDLILTGTPSGVGQLRPGARVEVEVPGVGVLSNPVEGPS